METKMDFKMKLIKDSTRLSEDEYYLVKKGTDFLAANYYNSNFNWPENADYNLLYIKDKLVGFVIVELWPESSFAFLSKLYVEEDQRGKGYGALMINYVKSFYKNYNQIEAGVVLENTASIKLFEKLATKKALLFQL